MTLFGKSTDDPLAGWLCCPACLTYCRPVMYLGGELAIFDCRACALRYFVGLGADPAMTTAPLAAEKEAAA